jgi:hypothetical protein
MGQGRNARMEDPVVNRNGTSATAGVPFSLPVAGELPLQGWVIPACTA